MPQIGAFMKEVYRIYKVVQDFEWSPYTDDMIQVDKDITIKYVDSKEKVDAFLRAIEEHNNKCLHCYNCPILRLTKRQYDNDKHNDVKDYCANKSLVFEGNAIKCNNEKLMDFTEYAYETIQVE